MVKKFIRKHPFTESTVRDNPDLDIVKILINYKKTAENDVFSIDPKEGHGWVLKHQFEAALIAGLRNSKKLLREWHARGYLKLQHPFFEVKSKKTATLSVKEKTDAGVVCKKKSAYRIKRSGDVWKALYLFCADTGIRKTFEQSDYFNDMRSYYNSYAKAFEKHSKMSASSQPALFLAFLKDQQQVEQQVEAIKKSIEHDYKKEYERLLKISKEAIALAKKK